MKSYLIYLLAYAIVAILAGILSIVSGGDFFNFLIVLTLSLTVVNFVSILELEKEKSR